MLFPSSIRRRAALLLGVVAVAATGLTAPAAQAAAPTTTPTYPLGLQPSPPSAVAPYAVPANGASFGDAPIPASVDLTPWAVPVGNQRNVGSCVSWTVGYTISGWYAKREGFAGTPYAPLFLYNQLTNGRGGATVGTTFFGNLSLEQSGGVLPLADFAGGNYTPTYLPTGADKTKAANYKITDWGTLYYNQTQSAASGQSLIKQALANDKPVALGIKVYQNFYGVNASNPYYGSVSGSFLGRHAVSVLGYDSYGVHIQNSWGTGWGSGGFAWLSWGFLANYSEEAYVVNGFTAPDDGPSPVVSSLSATSGPWTGGTISVTGSNLTGATVTFGSKTSPSVTVSSSTSLTAEVPAAAIGAVDVRVSTPTGGRSNAVTYAYTTATPTITSVSPAVGPNTGATAVTVTGTNLHDIAGTAYSLTVGGRAATSVVVASDGVSLTAVVPAGSIGAAEVKVTNAGGTSAAATYTYQWPVTPVLTIAGPRVTTIKSGRVALTGTLKLPSGIAVGKTTVRLESRPKGSSDAFQTVASVATTPNGKVSFATYPGSSVEYRLAAVGDVTSSSTVVITVQPAPVIRSMSATAGTKAGGETVTLTGENLFGARVTVGGTPASSVSVSVDGTSLTFVAPGRSPGKVTVQVITVTGKATAGSYSVTR